MNKVSNVVSEKLAVSNNQEQLKLLLDLGEGNTGMASAYTESYTHSEIVQTTSLDSYFMNKKVGKIRLIKIDIEGGEYPALLGMQDLLKQHKPALLIEINQDNPFGKEKIEKLLFDLDYKEYFLDRGGKPVNEKLPGDHSSNYVFICDRKV
jgi:hypothetical protein